VYIDQACLNLHGACVLWAYKLFSFVETLNMFNYFCLSRLVIRCFGLAIVYRLNYCFLWKVNYAINNMDLWFLWCIMFSPYTQASTIEMEYVPWWICVAFRDFYLLTLLCPSELPPSIGFNMIKPNGSLNQQLFM
jgi:hypothetical protein